MADHKDNHGKVGEVLYIKMTPENFDDLFKNREITLDKTTLSVEKLEGDYGVVSPIPIMVDEETQGDYEFVCENGIEIHYWGE